MQGKKKERKVKVAADELIFKSLFVRYNTRPKTGQGRGLLALRIRTIGNIEQVQ